MGDVNDVGRRVLKNLMDESKMHELENLTEDLVIVSHDLSPSDTASMYNKNIKFTSSHWKKLNHISKKITFNGSQHHIQPTKKPKITRKNYHP